MHERPVSTSDARYRPLKSYVAQRCGLRFAAHGGLRDSLVELAVDEWPEDCDLAHLEEVLRARLAIRCRQRYGSVVAMFLISIFINAIVRLAIEWWLDRDSNRALLTTWKRRAKEA